MAKKYDFEGVLGTLGTRRVSIEFKDSNNDAKYKFYCSTNLNDVALQTVLVSGMGAAVYQIAQDYSIPISMPTDVASLNLAINTVIAAIASQSQPMADQLAYCLINYFAIWDVPYFNNLLFYYDNLNGARSSLFFVGNELNPPYILDSNASFVSLPTTCPNVASVYIEFDDQTLL